MPEWSGETRNTLYQLLSEGRLEDALKLVKPHKTLRQNDYKPVDRAALKQFHEKLIADEKLEATLWHAVICHEKVVFRLCLVIFPFLSPLSGKALPIVWANLMKSFDRLFFKEDKAEDAKRWARYMDQIDLERLNFEDAPSSTPAPHLYYLASVDTYPMENLIQCISHYPSENGMLIFTEILKHYQYKIDTRYRNILIEMQRRFNASPNTTVQALAAENVQLNDDLAPKKKEKLSQENQEQVREELLILMSHADPDAIESLVNRLPKMSAAQVRKLCHDLPDDATSKLDNDSSLQSRIFCWMQDPGILGQIAVEWFNQSGWRQLRRRMMAWINEPANKNNLPSTGNGQQSYPQSDNTVRLKRHLDVLVEHVDKDLISLLISRHRDQASSIVFEGIAKRLSRQYEIMAAEKLLDSLAEIPTDADAFILSRYGDTIKRLRRNVMQYYCEKDPVFGSMYIGLPSPLPPDETKDKYQEWMEARNNNNYSIYTARYFINDERYSEETVAYLITCMQSSNDFLIENAFPLLVLRRDVVAKLGCDLTELTALGLWQIKSSEAKKAVYRLQALVQKGICSPGEACKWIEQAFDSEEASIWRTAAQAIVKLKEDDPSIELMSVGRIQELIARDEAKYGKFLNPLLS